MDNWSFLDVEDFKKKTVFFFWLHLNQERHFLLILVVLSIFREQ